MKNIFYSLLFSFAIGAFAQNTKIINDFKNFPINKPAPVVSKDKSRQVILVESKWKNSDFIEKIRADVMAFCVICSFDQTSRNLLRKNVRALSCKKLKNIHFDH